MANKVLFGMSELYVGIMTRNAQGVVTMGTPYKQAGAVGYSPEGNGENYTFYADNKAYYSSYTTGAYEGDLVVARFDDEFKIQFLGYVQLDDGGLAEVKGAVKPEVYLMFEVQGDEAPERVIYYGGSLGIPTREYATIEDGVEVQTESLGTTFVGDNATGITKVNYKQGDAGYATLFTNPPAPTLPSA